MNRLLCRLVVVFSGPLFLRPLSFVLFLLAFSLPTPAQVTNYLCLHSFGRTNLVGSFPVGAIVQAADGAIYGVTHAGGLYQPNSVGLGTVFKVPTDGSAYGLLHQFGDTDDTSSIPDTGLLLGEDGMLYGSSYAGTIFKIGPDGSGYRVLTDSNFLAAVGYSPPNSLAMGGDGMIYGTSDSAVFKLDANGTSLAVLAMPMDYFPAFTGVIQGSDGMLYATSQYGATNDNGAVFRMDTNGDNFTVLHQFTGINGDGASPMTGLIQTKAGVLFGSTASGGSNGLGTVFKLNLDGAGYTVVHSFARSNDATGVIALLEGTDAMIYGTAQSGYGAVFRMRPDGSNYTLLKVFSGGPADGQLARGGLLEGSDGRLYGTTELGGKYGLGTFFRMNKDGNGYVLLRDFLPWPADGINPRTALMEGSDGALYGTTDWNGSDVNGTVFRLNKDGSDYVQLASFADYMNGPLWEGAGGVLRGMTTDSLVYQVNKDGSGFSWQLNLGNLQPNAPLLETADATCYGTSPALASAPGGAVFGITSNNVTALLHSFMGPPGDGRFPAGPLLKASDDLLYGVTSAGGSSNAGTVFCLAPSGSGYAVVHQFSGDAAGGSGPYGQLLEASDGALYGLAASGGGTNLGFIYKIRKNGTCFQGLKAFTGAPTDGSLPIAPLAEGYDGVLYGLSIDAAGTGLGLLFRMGKDGSGFHAVRSVASAVPPLAGSDGALYVSTPFGGDIDGGTIYRFGQMLSLAKTPDTVLLGLAGIPGTTYDLQRSADLRGWTTLSTFLAPPDGSLSSTDSAPPPAAAFYRLVPR